MAIALAFGLATGASGGGSGGSIDANFKFYMVEPVAIRDQFMRRK